MARYDVRVRIDVGETMPQMMTVLDCIKDVLEHGETKDVRKRVLDKLRGDGAAVACERVADALERAGLEAQVVDAQEVP
jgi:hypothetical protein